MREPPPPPLTFESPPLVALLLVSSLKLNLSKEIIELDDVPKLGIRLAQACLRVDIRASA